MAKFKVGDRCKVIKNALAPECIGEIIEITGIQSKKGEKVLYKAAVEVEGKVFDCYASEVCLELVGKEASNEEDNV